MESEKELLEIEKIKEEIEKIRTEIVVTRWSRLRFWIGTVAVPVLVAAFTFYLVYKTGYFNAWQKQNEIAENKFRQDTTGFGFVRRALRKENDSIFAKNDSLSAVVLALTNQVAYYRKIIRNGLTKDEQINSLIFVNAGLRRTLDSISRTLPSARHLSATFESELMKKLARYDKRTIKIICEISNSSEPIEFSNELAVFFRSIGWQASVQDNYNVIIPAPTGVKIAFNQIKDIGLADTIKTEIAKVGYKCEARQIAYPGDFMLILVYAVG